MNTVNIIGRVGADIELRHTPAGKAVTELNLAVDDGWGENKKTVWIGVTIWGATAELAAKALTKGSRVGINGRLSQEEWEDKNTGKKQRKTKVTCESMHLIEAKRESYSEPQMGEYRQDAHNQSKSNGYQAQPEDNQDFPF
jgi:single-strand DNA-binding protein